MDDEADVQHQHLEPSLDAVGDAQLGIENRLTRCAHQTIVERSGARRRLSPEEAEHHSFAVSFSEDRFRPGDRWETAPGARIDVAS